MRNVQKMKNDENRGGIAKKVAKEGTFKTKKRLKLETKTIPERTKLTQLWYQEVV